MSTISSQPDEFGGRALTLCQTTLAASKIAAPLPPLISKMEQLEAAAFEMTLNGSKSPYFVKSKLFPKMLKPQKFELRTRRRRKPQNEKHRDSALCGKKVELFSSFAVVLSPALWEI